MRAASINYAENVYINWSDAFINVKYASVGIIICKVKHILKYIIIISSGSRIDLCADIQIILRTGL